MAASRITDPGPRALFGVLDAPAASYGRERGGRVDGIIRADLFRVYAQREPRRPGPGIEERQDKSMSAERTNSLGWPGSAVIVRAWTMKAGAGSVLEQVAIRKAAGTHPGSCHCKQEDFHTFAYWASQGAYVAKETRGFALPVGGRALWTSYVFCKCQAVTHE